MESRLSLTARLGSPGLPPKDVILCTKKSPQSLEVFVGSATKPVLDEAAALFERETGITVLLHFGGSGTMRSEMKLARRGDLYVPDVVRVEREASDDDVAQPVG